MRKTNKKTSTKSSTQIRHFSGNRGRLRGETSNVLQQERNDCFMQNQSCALPETEQTHINLSSSCVRDVHEILDFSSILPSG